MSICHCSAIIANEIYNVTIRKWNNARVIVKEKSILEIASAGWYLLCIFWSWSLSFDPERRCFCEYGSRCFLVTLSYLQNTQTPFVFWHLSKIEVIKEKVNTIFQMWNKNITFEVSTMMIMLCMWVIHTLTFFSMFWNVC
jgi:hypothetical protein